MNDMGDMECHYESVFEFYEKVCDSSFDPLRYSVRVSPIVLEVFSNELFAHNSSNMTSEVRDLPEEVKESMKLEYSAFSDNLKNSRFVVGTSDPWISSYLIHYVICKGESPADCKDYFDAIDHDPSNAELKELWAFLQSLDRVSDILNRMDSHYIFVYDPEKGESYTHFSDQRAPFLKSKLPAGDTTLKENKLKYDFYFSEKQFQENIAVGCGEQFIEGRLYTDCVEAGGYPTGKYDDYTYVDSGPFKNTFNWGALERK